MVDNEVYKLFSFTIYNDLVLENESSLKHV